MADGKRICLTCGGVIVEGAHVVRDYFYVRRNDAGIADNLEMGQGVAILLKSKQDNLASLTQFSRQTVKKFVQAGLGNGRGSRTVREAEQFYRASVPAPVRNLGEGAVKQFTKDKQASHIQSFANAKR